MNIRIALALLASVSLAPLASAEKWLKIDPKDPYSKGGEFHAFDIDSAFEDNASGFIVGRMTYKAPDKIPSEGVSSWHVWVFDCKAKTVYYAGSPAEGGGTKIEADWSKKPNTLSKPVMGGVTNTFGKKLCALKGSWPKGDLTK